MRRYAIALLIACTAQAGDLPDAKLTPGAVRQVSVTELCTTRTKAVRMTSASTKRAVYAEYGIEPRNAAECSGPTGACYEVDHLIPLVLGGADVKADLWVQLYDGPNNAHDKDRLEKRLAALVCDGKMPLADAQACIASNWIACKQKVMP